jgi:hypothetical protein
MTIFLTTPPRRSFGYRVAIFTFGVLAYALGVGALVALVLISVGVLPFTGGPIGKLPLPAALALDLGLLVIFGAQHSVMARPAFKARWTRVIPAAAERSTYLFATALALLPLLLLWQPLPAVIWSADGATARGLLIAVTLGGWVYLLAASFAINHFELFGLEQVYRALRDPPTGAVLVSSALDVPLRSSPDHERHPDRAVGDADHDRRSAALRTRDHDLHLHRRIFRGARAAPPIGPPVRGVLPTRALAGPDVQEPVGKPRGAHSRARLSATW